MSGEKTEDPTPKKLRDARKKGQVAKSKEVSGTLSFVAVVATLWFMGGTFLEGLQAMVLLPAKVYNEDFKFAFGVVYEGMLDGSIKLILPIIIVSAFSAIFGNFVQFGMLFSSESIKPDIKKIDPVQGTKKIFSMKNLVEFFKSIIKIVFLSLVVYWVIVVALPDMVNIPYCGTSCILPIAVEVMKQLLLYAIAAFAVIAVLDFLFEKHNFTKEQRMTKDEVKREYKEMEGNPEVKGKRREIHHEILHSAEGTRKADVVIKNPTHLAIGLYYKQGSTPLPIVTVKGKGSQARFIIKVAEKEGIPILENVPLAHSLFDTKVSSYIPSDLIEPVAEVFRWVQDIKNNENDNVL